MVNSMVRVRGVFRMSNPGHGCKGGLERGAAVCWTGPVDSGTCWTCWMLLMQQN